MSARSRELFALIPVALLVTAGFTAIFIVESEQLGNLSFLYGAYFLGALRRDPLRHPRPAARRRPFLFPLVALLAAFGMVMLFRLDEGLARDQANWFVLGLVAVLADDHLPARLRGARALPLRDRARRDRPAAAAAAARDRRAGQRAPTSASTSARSTFQPTELAKICIVVFLASYLNERREVLVVGARNVAGIVLPPLKHLGPLLVVWGAAMVMLVFIRDLGSSLMFFGAFLAMIYVATARISFVIIGLAMFVVGAWFFANTVGHVQDRFDIWLDPFNDAEGDGYQVAQSLFAQADGGLFGRGLGESLVAVTRRIGELRDDFPNCGAILPAPHTDFIYAVIVNELGLFGGARASS